MLFELETSLRDNLKSKGGPELFRELLRVLPTGCWEDYCKNGVWQNDVLRLDIEILTAHKEEAGAPDPPPLSEVKLPDIPQMSKLALGSAMLPGMIRPLATVPGLRPAIPGALATVTGAAAPQAAAAPGLVAAAGATADVRNIALFLSKWKLDPTRAKTVLSNLTPHRRRYVMQNFKYIQVNGTAPIAKLEEYITECEKTCAWGPEPETPEPEENGTPAVAGVKRPLEQAADAAAPVKRPNTGADAVVTGAALAGAKLQN